MEKGKEVAVKEQHSTDVARVISRSQKVEEITGSVMKAGMHYGKIPGTPKPSLWKPGAEKLCMTFEFSERIDQVDDLSTDDECRIRTIVGIYSKEGALIAQGIGEASSNEEKYKWRASIGDEEFDATPADRRRIKFKKDKDTGKIYKVKQIRTEIADERNTIAKMSHKRGFVAGTLIATAASDTFTQDIEDIPTEYLPNESKQNGKPPTLPPQQKAPEHSPEQQAGPGHSTEAMIVGLKVSNGKKQDGSPWTLTTISTDSDKHLKTFDMKFGEILSKAHETGTPLKLTYDDKNMIQSIEPIQEPGSDN